MWLMMNWSWLHTAINPVWTNLAPPNQGDQFSYNIFAFDDIIKEFCKAISLQYWNFNMDTSAEWMQTKNRNCFYSLIYIGAAHTNSYPELEHWRTHSFFLDHDVKKKFCTQTKIIYFNVSHELFWVYAFYWSKNSNQSSTTTDILRLIFT